MCHHCDSAKKEAEKKGKTVAQCGCCASEWIYEKGGWQVVDEGVVGYSGA